MNTNRAAIEAELLQANNAHRTAINNVGAFRLQARHAKSSQELVRINDAASYWEERANKEIDRIFKLEAALS